MDIKNKIRVIGLWIVVVCWAVLSIFAWFKPSTESSVSERRPLDQFPELSVSTILSGDFTSNFESYTLDQFPGRDLFRQVKSYFHYYTLCQSDNNGIYIYEDFAVKTEYPLNQASLENANKKFNHIYNKYLKNSNVKIYTSVVPDKNYYLSDKSNHLKMDYDAIFNSMKSLKWGTYIDITPMLSAGHYYFTDTHWRQDGILLVSTEILDAMGSNMQDLGELRIDTVQKPFYGVYHGQAALPLDPDIMCIISSDMIEQATVFDYETNKTIPIYNEGAYESKDLYDIYLHGSKPLLRIDNPNAKTDKELVIFRDSFGSSIAPLLINDYKTITLVDIRYIASDFIGNYIKFENQDVLFLYSTLVLNNSFTFK